MRCVKRPRYIKEAKFLVATVILSPPVGNLTSAHSAPPPPLLPFSVLAGVQEFAPAQYGLAYCLDTGIGVPRADRRSALILLTIAAQDGFRPAVQPLLRLLAAENPLEFLIDSHL